MSQQKYSDELHLHPFDFPIANLDSLPSTLLTLVQFHRKATSADISNATIIWQQRRAHARSSASSSRAGEPGIDSRPTSTKECDLSHCQNLDFSLANLKALSSRQLALVLQHPDEEDEAPAAAALFWKRVNRDAEKGIEYAEAESVTAGEVHAISEDLQAKRRIGEEEEVSRKRLCEAGAVARFEQGTPEPLERRDSMMTDERAVEDPRSTRESPVFDNAPFAPRPPSQHLPQSPTLPRLSTSPLRFSPAAEPKQFSPRVLPAFRPHPLLDAPPFSPP